MFCHMNSNTEEYVLLFCFVFFNAKVKYMNLGLRPKVAGPGISEGHQRDCGWSI